MSPRESMEAKKARAKKIVTKLKKMYPDAQCSLMYTNPLELLIATMLSAQCTDARVNKVTPDLFAEYKTPQDYANAEIGELEILVKTTGFFRNKAKNIKACGQALVERHGGEIPSTVEELSALPGVGRKTANVVLGNVFGKPAMVVDTHVTRISNLMDLAKGKDAVKLEHQLMDVISKKDWTIYSHLLIDHGRAICKARRPNCDECDLKKLCPQKGL